MKLYHLRYLPLAVLVMQTAVAEPEAPTSYALGTQFAGNVITVLGEDKFILDDFMAGVRDSMENRQTRLSGTEIAALMGEYTQKMQAGQAPKASNDVSYALGVMTSKDMSLERSELNLDAFIAGIGDVLGGKELRYTEAEILSLVEQYFEQWLQRLKQRAADNLDAGKQYLQRNSEREGVTELDNGLQYEVLQSGDGTQPTAQSRVRVHYRGSDINGEEFDSSYRNGTPATFSLQGVIQGWQQILPRMRAGAKWRIHVPPELAYGERGAPPAIGPNQTLVFDIELLEVL